MSDRARSLVETALMSIAVVILLSAQPHDDRSAEPFWTGNKIRWPRTMDELRQECEKVNEKAAPLLALDPDELDSVEKGIMGVWTAAAWTTGASSASPMTRRTTPLDAAHLVQEIRMARALSADRSMPTMPYALGVVSWLSWITGVADRVLYPDEA